MSVFRRVSWVVLSAVIVWLAGCSPPMNRPMSRAEWLAATQKTYSASPDEVLNAAERLFTLADGRDFSFMHTPESLIASRRWSVYMVLALSFGSDHWQVDAAPGPNGTVVRVRVNTSDQPVLPMATSGGNATVTTMPLSGRPITGTAIYDLFWARLDYLLGERTDWTNCKAAIDKRAAGETWGNIEALCNFANMTDDHPEKPPRGDLVQTNVTP